MSKYRKLLEELVDAATLYVDEHTAGGVLLARLSDAKKALEKRVSPAQAIKDAFYEGFIGAHPDEREDEKWRAEAHTFWEFSQAKDDFEEHDS